MKVIKKIPWISTNEYTTLKITPDSSVRNWRSVDIVNTISDMYKLPIDRIKKQGPKITAEPLKNSSFEIRFEKGKVCFYFTVPTTYATLFIKRIESIWDRVSIEEVKKELLYNANDTAIYELLYKHHYIYSLSADAKDNLPLPSLIESGRLVEEYDTASVFTLFTPMSQNSWNSEVNSGWHQLYKGIAPRNWNMNVKELVKLIASSLSSLMSEIVGELSDIISSGKEGNKYVSTVSDPMATQFSIDNLSSYTKSKKGKSGIKVNTFTIVKSRDMEKSSIVAQTLGKSFSDLSGDNSLQEMEVKSKSKKENILNVYHNHSSPTINIRSNKMSTDEASKFIQLPGLELQEKYKEIERIEQTQLQIQNKQLLDNCGMLIGSASYKSNTQKIYQPIDDLDELCLPHVGIGGMGQGKTQGLLVNYLLEFTKKGFGALAVDPAKGEIQDEIKKAVSKGIISQDKVQYIDIGNSIFSLDFCEALQDKRAKARLANIVVDFFGVNNETTGQTERFLRAAVLAMETGKINEILSIFQNNERLNQAIAALHSADDEFNSNTLMEFKEYSEGRRAQILSPIYNRINDILGDPYLAQCLKSDHSLDFVDIMSTNKLYVINVSAKDLDKVAIDLIVSLISLKIDLAMRMREKVTGKEFPFLVAIDEPHQFSKSTRVWEDAVVESRKFRICYFWTFHYWEQIPANLQRAIRSSLPHYHIYPTTSLTFRSLAEEILPFTLQDALKLKRWHAINIIRAGGENAQPFIAKMTSPPSKRMVKNIL